MKLLKFKQWLTIKETASYLATLFDEKVSTKDIYRLALYDQLTLSLHFINSTKVEVANFLDAGYQGIDQQNVFHLPNNLAIHFNQPVFTIMGSSSCVDLVNIYGGNLVIRQYCYTDSQLVKEELSMDKSIIFTLPNQTDRHFRLINNETTEGNKLSLTLRNLLPEDIRIVMTTQHLMEFIDKVNNKDAEKLNKLHAKERASLCQLIAILATMANLPITHHYKTADIINEVAPSLNIESPSRGTISKYLKEASHYVP